jgi:Rieske 2Fe-2S family protein
LFVSLLDIFPLDYDNPADPRIADFLNNLRKRGIADRPQEGAWYSAGHIPLQPGMKSITMDGGHDVAKLLADDVSDLGYLRWGLEPHCYNVALPDYVFTFSVTPLSAQRTLVHSKWLVHKDAVEGVDYDVKKVRQLWETTNNQDISLTEINQRGVNCSGYRPGRYIPGSETLCEQFTDWYCDEAARYLNLISSTEEKGGAEAVNDCDARGMRDLAGY